MTPSNEHTAAQEIRERFLEVETSNVADVLDELGLVDQGLAPVFRRMAGAQHKLCGWAFPIQGEMTAYPVKGGDPDKMTACEALGPDTVSVWAGAGSGVCFFGELIALRMRERGCVGALVDGGIRDVAWIDRQDFAVFARYMSSVQSIGRWKVREHAHPVLLPGATTSEVTVRPGDFVLGDADGVVVIPAHVVGEVLERTEVLGEKERLIRMEIGEGLSLKAALAKFGHV